MVAGAIAWVARGTSFATARGIRILTAPAIPEDPMRTSKPRIAPLPDSAFNADQKEIIAPIAANGRVLNIFRTLIHAPKAMQGFLSWGNYVLSKRNDLPAREREIVILRIGFLCKSGYEWTQHVAIALRV